MIWGADESPHHPGGNVIGGLVKPDRREFLRVSLLGSGALLAGFDKLSGFPQNQSEGNDPFRGGKRLELVEFAGESRAPLDTVIGVGLDARLYSDLSTLTLNQLVTPIEKFYIRTRASELLEAGRPWRIKLAGRVQEPANLTLDDLQRSAKPMGMHLMECSGNARSTRFGLLSVKSATSIPGADWIFRLEELKTTKAFLATGMNGRPLTRDHGAPVRLVVPGWYACTCIKWVNAITFIDEDAEATSQMQEFAARTHQQGVPKLAKDYRPAAIDQAAMPTRVEKWLVNGRIKYRVTGILWGGSRPIKVLEIRFNPEEDYVRVDKFSQTTNDPWSFWSHEWTPKTTGAYMIRLRVTDPEVQTRRLDSGYYVRSVEVTEV